jgi:hypothetical protein
VCTRGSNRALLRGPSTSPLGPMSESPSRPSRAKRTLVVTLAALALATWFAFIYLTMHYDATLPRTPDAISGRVIPQNTHGSIVYLTRSEEFSLRCLGWGSGLLFLMAVVLDRRWKALRRRPIDDLPRDVRDRILNGPPSDYDKIRATYNDDSDDSGRA